MKELSIEEKARRYDGAIERAKKWRNAPNIDKIPTFGNRVIEEIFPELKESEDEKIRKAIYNCVKWFGFDSCFFKDVSQEECLAWLEKQAQKSIWSKEDKNMLKQVIGYLENKILNTPISEERTVCKNAVAWLEEKLKGEPNPCDGCINRKGCINCENGELRETEQKPWSEEDENMLKIVITSCEQCGNEYAYYWLKSLKNRVQPQSQWKPSERQKEALLWCVVHLGGADKQTLGELLEELNKL